MSYEGYVQYLCEKGHYSSEDCYMEELQKCPICGKKIVWRNGVDVTNGSFDTHNGERIDGYVELEIKSQRKCKECGSILETQYHIPKRSR